MEKLSSKLSNGFVLRMKSDLGSDFEKYIDAFNDSLNYNYYGLTGWLSSTNINSDFYNKIGYYSDNNMGFYNSYVLLESLFGVKY